MDFDNTTIDKIAHLARLIINEDERVSLKSDMNKILHFMDKLNELDTEGTEPLIYLTDEVNVFREDIVLNSNSSSEALVNSPVPDASYFKVAKVINK